LDRAILVSPTTTYLWLRTGEQSRSVVAPPPHPFQARAYLAFFDDQKQQQQQQQQQQQRSNHPTPSVRNYHFTLAKFCD